jgi:hypothetical protein
MDSGRLETVPNGTVHLDTVRALHQTVVSLRTALEVSKNELKELKEKYEQHSRCNEFADVIEKLTIENHILRRKIIDSGHEEDPNTQNIKLEVTFSPRTRGIEDFGSEVLIQTATTDVKVDDDFEPTLDPSEGDKYGSSEDFDNDIEDQELPNLEISEEHLSPNVETESSQRQESQLSGLPQESVKTCQPTFRTKLELLSKFDVRIKVQTSKEGALVSSSTSDTDSTIDENKREKKRSDSRASFNLEEKIEHFEEAEDPKGNKINIKTVARENVKMAVPSEAEAKSKTDKFDVQVRITSEENLIVKENVERSRRKDTLNLDVDDLSLR